MRLQDLRLYGVSLVVTFAALSALPSTGRAASIVADFDGATYWVNDPATGVVLNDPVHGRLRYDSDAAPEPDSEQQALYHNVDELSLTILHDGVPVHSFSATGGTIVVVSSPSAYALYARGSTGLEDDALLGQPLEALTLNLQNDHAVPGATTALPMEISLASFNPILSFVDVNVNDNTWLSAYITSIHVVPEPDSYVIIVGAALAGGYVAHARRSRAGRRSALRQDQRTRDNFEMRTAGSTFKATDEARFGRRFYMCRRFFNLQLITTVVLCGAARAATFTNLGSLGGYSTYGVPFDLSENGLVIVGWSASPTVYDESAGFRWSSGLGMEQLPDIPAGVMTPSAVSANGQVIAGNSGAGYPIAHRWTSPSGWQSLGDLPGGDALSYANAISSSGATIVGASRTEPRSASTTGWQAFRWTGEMGMTGLGYANPNDVESNALAMSADARFIVGTFTTATHNTYAFRWSTEAGMQPLAGDPANSQANAISNDGRVIAGVSMGGFGPLYRAFRWTEDGGMQNLGVLEESGFHPSSIATGMTSDGSIVVGHSYAGTVGDNIVPFIWDASHGMRSIQEMLLNEFGLAASLAGLTLTLTPLISADGKILAGTAFDKLGGFHGWRVDLNAHPARSPLGDLDQNGVVEGPDLIKWSDSFGGIEAASTQGDVDGDADVDGTDFLLWQRLLGSAVPALSANGTLPEPTGLLLIVAGTMATFPRSVRMCRKHARS
jgi:probable HAF family extracellular repeat protein